MNVLKQQVIDAGIMLCSEGLIARTWGNVSVKLDDEHFGITASGREYKSLTEEDIVKVSIADLSYEGQVKPSSEKMMHQVIYRNIKDAGFVIHTHQCNASAVSAMGLETVYLPGESRLSCGAIACARYASPGSCEIALNVQKALDSLRSKAILMANHGAVCFGRDYEEAFENVMMLEKACGEFLESFNIRPWDKAGNESICKQHEGFAYAYLDDFAQMFGKGLDLSGYDLEKLAKEYNEDEESVKLVIEKNQLAAEAAGCTGASPIDDDECSHMHSVYVSDYSKLKGE